MELSKVITAVVRCIHAIFVIVLMLFGIFLSLLHITFWIPLLIMHIRTTYAYIKPFYVFLMYTYLSFILEYLSGIRFHVCVSPPTYHFLEEFKRSKAPGSILFNMNHRTRLDWMMIWPAMQRFGIISYLTIVSRELLRYVPILGWAFCWAGIFISRNWAKDKSQFMDMIKVLGSNMIQPKSMFLFFSEGTDLWYKAIQKSNSYANENSLQEYKYVLHPRTRGFCQMVHGLNDSLYCILDGTIGYVDHVNGERMNELTAVQGRFVRDVYLYFEIYTVDDIVNQYQQHYDNDNDGFKVDSYIKKPFYIPSSYIRKNKRQKYIECFDNDNKKEMNVVDNAITDFIKKTFEKKEIRLKDWYENKIWIGDVKDKVEYSVVPRSAYIIAIVYTLLHIFPFIWFWNHYLWVIGIISAVHTIGAYFDLVGKIIRSHRKLIDKMESKRKQNKLNKQRQNIQRLSKKEI